MDTGSASYYETVNKLHHHESADLAVVELVEPVPQDFEQFLILSADQAGLGTLVNAFGVVCDSSGRTNVTRRLIAGVIQRNLLYESDSYRSEAVELSMPIPTGMSGAPVFQSTNPTIALGLAIATIESRVVVHAVEEYEDRRVTMRETIARIVEYGVALHLGAYHGWLREIVDADNQTAT